ARAARRRGDDPWDITNRPHTKAKLRLLRDYFSRWTTIWNAPKQRVWADRTWYVVDLFAGRGSYSDDDQEVSGSPLVYLECIARQEKKLLGACWGKSRPALARVRMAR
ncbi:MAG: three-Cys-motif partner protein TcmP, partial [Actinomycetota bacterium]|nr:three-Cys-motif partner protein TcmP [Actinomycetota bacterium]